LLGTADPLGRAPGEPLCPRRFSTSALERLRRDVGSLAWAAQYSGVPRAAEGNRFKRAWFLLAETAPVQARRVRCWDKAGSAGRGCYSVGVLIARTEDGLIHVEDVVRGQWSAHERNQVMLSTAQLDAGRDGNSVHIFVEQEPGSGGLESAQTTVRLLAGYPVRAETVTGNKEVRAEPFAA
jgi:phage terminase large subunit-like protein